MGRGARGGSALPSEATVSIRSGEMGEVTAEAAAWAEAEASTPLRNRVAVSSGRER